MPIKSIHEIRARKAAQAAQALQSQTPAPPEPSPAPDAANLVVGTAQPAVAGAGAGRSIKRPRKEVRPKRQPTGDYEQGYCRAPIKNRFDGSRPGPGRPRGALSQDTLLKKHLTEIHSVARGGRQTKAQTRELILMLKVKAALGGDRRAQNDLLADAARLFAERRDAAEPSFEPANMDEHDQALLEALRDTMFPKPQQDNEAGRREDDDPYGAQRAGGRS